MGDKKVLFEITEDHLDTGLRGFPVGTCTTSKVDPELGLFYRGYAIPDIAHREPEEIIYLLMEGEFPTEIQLKEFKNTLVASSRLHPGVIEYLRGIPKHAHPMKWLLGGINAMGMYSGTDDYAKDAIIMTAQMPEMVAAIYRIRSGWGEPIASKPELGYMQNFTQMLGAPNASPHLEKLMKVFNVLHMDHGGGNLSTFVGKAIASGLEDMYGSMIGAMAALAGPLHGMANQECLRFLRQVSTKVKDPTDHAEISNWLEAHFAAGGKIYGFGHAVLRVEDPRAAVEYDLGQQIAKDNPLFQLSLSLRKVGSDFLKKQPKVSNPYPNVDAVSGSLLSACGLTDDDYYTVLFGLSRTVGIAAQIVYDRTVARYGKGTPIIRPKYIYTGPVRGNDKSGGLAG